MIECRDFNARIMSSGKKRVARSQARAQNSQFRVALVLQPVEAATDIKHTLPSSVERAADVGRDGVVGAPYLRRTPYIVIRHAQPQHRNSQPVQHWSQPVMAEAVRVPLRQHHDRALPFFRRKPARIHQVVLRIRTSRWRGKPQELAVAAANLVFQFWLRDLARAEHLKLTPLEAEVGWLLVREELVAIGDGPAVV